MKYPASYLQSQYWLHDQTASENSAYNIISTFRFGPQLNEKTMERAFSLAMQNAPVFSVRYHFENDTLYAIEDISNTPQLTFSDQIFETETDALIFMREFASIPFNLATGPLARATLVRLRNGDACMCIVAHHSVIDLRTKDLLGKAIAEHYMSLAQGDEATPALSQTSYAAYANWYADWLNSENGTKEKEYWKEAYSEMSGALDFPFDFQRPSSPSFKGGAVPISGTADELSALQNFCKSQVSQPYLVLLACYLLLLRKYTRDDVITVGIPLTNRMHPEHKDTLGCFMNIVPLTVTVSCDMTFAALLRAVRKAMLIAHRHQSLPFSQIVDAINPPTDRSRNPLFQTLFTFEHPMNISLDGVECQSIDIHGGGAQLDFSMALWLSDDGLRGHVEYSSDLLQESTAIRLISHFKHLLSRAIAAPDTAICNISLLNKNEYETIVRQWNATEIAYPPIDGLHQFLERQVEKTPDLVAVEMPNQKSLTYREFNQQCNRLAHYLISIGTNKGSRIGVYMKRSVEMVIALHAIEKAGGAYVPLEPDFPDDRISHMIEDAAIGTVLCTSACTLKSTFNVCTVSVDNISEMLESFSNENPNVDISGSDDAYIIFTSGSTGGPKGVLNGHAGICNRIFWMQDAFELTEKDAVLQKTPFTFDVSVWEFFWPFMCGAKLIVAPPDTHRDPTALCSLIRDYNVTTIHFVPSMLEAFLGSPAIQCANGPLKRIICSGETLNRSLQDRCLNIFSTAGLYNLYGPTEAAVDVTYWQCGNEDARTVVPIGCAIANTQIYILDTQMNPVPIGVPGELHIGGVQVAKGYVNRPELTAERFIPDPFDVNGSGRLYKTGDWARFRPDGNIEFIGRMDGQVKIHGLRIELEEISVTIVESMPQIRNAVTVINTDGADSRLVAYLVTENGATIDEKQLRKQLLNRLPRYMVPEIYVCIDQIPLSANGKLDRRRLPPAQISIAESFVGQAPGTETEMTIAGIWKEILQLETVGTERNFYDVGGTSILALHLINRLNAEYDQDLTPLFVFNRSTIKEQAEHFDSRSRNSSLDFDVYQKRAEKMRAAANRQRRRRGSS